MEDIMKKKIFLTLIAIVAVALSVPAFAANGGVNTWGGVGGTDYMFSSLDYGAVAPGFELNTEAQAAIGAFNGAAGFNQSVNFLHAGPVTIVDTWTSAAAQSPWYGAAGASTEMNTSVSVLNMDAYLSSSSDLITVGSGRVSSQQSGAVVIIH